MRTTRVLAPQSWVVSASTIFARAPGFSSGAQASSRSRNTSSAALAAAFSIILGLLPGQARTDRRRRWGMDGNLLAPGPRGGGALDGTERPSTAILATGPRMTRCVRGSGSVLRPRPGRAVVVRRTLVRRGGPTVVGRRLPAAEPGEARREAGEAAHAPEELLELLGAAEIVLDALHQLAEQLVEARVLDELLLDAAELGHQVLDRRLLGHLHEHRLGGRGGDHLGLLAEHLEAAAGEALAAVVAAAELGLETVELAVEAAEVDRRRLRVHPASIAPRRRAVPAPDYPRKAKWAKWAVRAPRSTGEVTSTTRSTQVRRPARASRTKTGNTESR